MGLQDANWSELLKFCAARGAYRGAGSESLSQLMRGQYDQDMPLPGETGDKGHHTLTLAYMHPCLSNTLHCLAKEGATSQNMPLHVNANAMRDTHVCIHP